MSWYTKLFAEKLNPAQPDIGGTVEQSTEYFKTYTAAYEQLEAVNRGVNMIVDDSSEIPVVIGEQVPGTAVAKGVKKATVNRLLNFEPNPFQDISTFKRNLYIDYLLDGNIFIYFDGDYLYHLPANKVSIETSTKTYIKEYIFNGHIHYAPSEIIHVKENSFRTIFRGTSRLKSAKHTMEILGSMKKFQNTFFENGAVPGLVIKSPNTLSQKIKERLIASWVEKYRPDTGGKRPLILDGGLELDTISNVSFKELDFQSSIKENDNIVLQALGVPPILLDSGNNANIRPNLRLYYLETILSITNKVNSAYQRYFGFKVTDDLVDIPALQPELRDQASYYSTLVNTGILTPNEARYKLGFAPDTSPESDQLRIPANIAGSAANPSEGGRPTDDQGDDKK